MTLSRKDALQTLVSPIEKLIEAVSGAIGKAYEPCHIKRMANAKAYEVRTISDAVRNNSDIPIVYDSSSVLIDTSKYEEIAKRKLNEKLNGDKKIASKKTLIKKNLK